MSDASDTSDHPGGALASGSMISRLLPRVAAPWHPGVGRLMAALDPPLRGQLLEIRCGSGDRLTRMADAYPHTRIYGIDSRPDQIAVARRRIDDLGFGDRIEVAEADPVSFDARALFGAAPIDRVVCCYALSHFADWTGVLARCHRALDGDGRLVALDFGSPDRASLVVRPLLRQAARLSGATPLSALKDVFLHLARRDGRTVRVERPLGGYAQLLSIV